VAHALPNSRCIADISGLVNDCHACAVCSAVGSASGSPYLQLSAGQVRLEMDAEQAILNAIGLSGVFVGQCGLPGAKELDKAKVPPSSKLFVWTALLSHCWTSERLQRHGLRNNGPCALCHQASESIEHLLLNCVYAREVWFTLLRRAGFHQLCPVMEVSLAEWWLRRRKSVQSDCRKGFDSFVVLVTWHLWKGRNARVFDQASRQAGELVSFIVAEGRNWVAAGFSVLADFLHSRRSFRGVGYVLASLLCALLVGCGCTLEQLVSPPLNQILAGCRVHKFFLTRFFLRGKHFWGYC
jgi:hypothetical protein